MQKRNRLYNLLPAGSVLKRALEQWGLGPALSRHGLVAMWPKIVDATVARHTRADKVVGATLYLSVDSSVWMSEISAVKHIIIEKINRILDRDAAPITEIRLRQCSRIEREARPVESPAESPEVDPAEMRWAEPVVASIKDEELRKTLNRILIKNQKLNNKRKSQKG